MTFKEFVGWCNDRACDGCWGSAEAMTCIALIEDVKSVPFWRRGRYWKEKYAERVEKEIVDPINKMIEDVYGEKESSE